MSRAWLCRKGRFWRFWGCRQEWGNCIWRVWLWGRCRQSNAAHLHPVGLVGPETQTKHTLSFSSLLSRAELTREKFRAQRAEHPNFFNIFYFNLQIYMSILKFIKNIHQPSWLTAERAYRCRPRRQHAQPSWPAVTALRPPLTVRSRVWSLLTAVRQGGNNYDGRALSSWRTAAATPV
jgi:hypothetical protein